MPPTDTPICTVNPANITATAQAVLNVVLRKDNRPVIYFVGVDIAPGVWHSTPGREDCYWSWTDMTGNIIDNFFGFSGVTIYIASSDFEVEQDNKCVTWT